jgi:UDP-glucose 4-epimerase
MSSDGRAELMILGGSGFIGRRLSHHVRARRRTAAWSSAECNLLDAAQTRQRLEVCGNQTTVVMCASVTRVVEDSWPAFETNLALVRNLMESLARRPPRSLVFLSSSDVYGLPAAELPIKEETLPRPTTFYGLAKLAGETLCLLMRQGDWPTARLRLPGIYGPGDRGRSVVGRFCQRLAARQPLEITGAGTVRRDYVHVDDLCRLIEALHEEPWDGLVNVATGTSVSVNHLVEVVAASLGASPVIERLPAREDRDHDLVFDTRRLRSTFPRLTFRPIERGVQDYLAASQAAD